MRQNVKTEAPVSAFPAQSPALGWLSFSFCRSFDPLLSGRGNRGGPPLGAERRPLWGAPGNTKAMLATPQDRAAGCPFRGSFFYGALDRLPFYPEVFRPLSAALSRSLPGLGGHGAIITLGRSFSCQRQKRIRHIDAPTPAGVFLSLGLVRLCTGSKAVFSSPIKWEF